MAILDGTRDRWYYYFFQCTCIANYNFPWLYISTSDCDHVISRLIHLTFTVKCQLCSIKAGRVFLTFFHYYECSNCVGASAKGTISVTSCNAVGFSVSHNNGRKSLKYPAELPCGAVSLRSLLSISLSYILALKRENYICGHCCVGPRVDYMVRTCYPCL